GRSPPSDSFIPQRHFGPVGGRSLGKRRRPAPAGTSTSAITGIPGSPTLAERVIIGFRLPYILGCILVGFVLLGILNTVLSKYVETTDLLRAVIFALSPQSLAQSALFAYSFYAPRYMRTKLLEAGRSLPALMPEKDEGFRKTFTGVSAVRPQLATWIVFLAALLLALSVPVAFGGPSPFRFNTAASSSAPALGGVVGVGVFLFGLILLGLFLFFLPLSKLHGRMIAEKKIARATLNPKLQTLFQESPNAASDDVAQVLRLDMMDRKVAGMALWPYDIGILGRLSVIAASVTAILISRIIALVFHII